MWSLRAHDDEKKKKGNYIFNADRSGKSGRVVKVNLVDRVRDKLHVARNLGLGMGM